MDKLQIGDTFRGWSIESTPKAGASGAVYRARRTDDVGAIKIFTGRVGSDDYRRFLREVEILHDINHPSVPKVIEDGTKFSSPYVVMTFFTGKNLYDWRMALSQAPTPQTAFGIVAKIARALGEILSNAKYVHRDIKLENIIFDEDLWSVGIVDFGLAKRIDDLFKLPSSWEQQAAPRYRSPEKFVDFHSVTQKGDVWSLGVILYFLLVKRFPFEVSHAAGSEYKLMEIIRNEPHRPPSEYRVDCRGQVDELIALLLSKSESIRPDLTEALGLLSINPSEQAAPSLFGQYADARSRQYRSFSFSWEDWAGVGLAGQIDRLLSEDYRVSIARHIGGVLQKATKHLFEYKVQWGPFKESDSPKAANVAEVLYAIGIGTLDAREVTSLRAATDWLLSIARPDGIPSLSLNRAATTYCTAISSLALKSSSLNWARLDAGYATDLQRLSDKLAHQCLALAHPSGGWGTFGRSGPVRINTSIWALRALACSAAIADDVFLGALQQIRAMHSEGKEGQFGFQPRAEPQLGTTALWLLLLHDVRFKRQLYLDQAVGESQHPIRFINAMFDSGHPDKRVEHEVYYVDRDDYQFTGGVEQLNWNHPSEALAVEALARSEVFDIYDQQQFAWFGRAMNMLQELEANGTIAAPWLGRSGCVYLTCFAIRALRSSMNWLKRSRCGEQ